MREIIKNQLYDMIKMMEEAMEFCGAPEEMVGLLADCQQAAVHIANVIEEKVDPQHDCIKCLEEYAELIYRAGNIIHDDQQYFLLIEAAHKQLLLVKEQIRYRIEKTFEIVFLPYKASMWDCFDSIYRTIAQEGKHNAVVMPIPYFNMDSHQKSIDMVYEGQDFPEDIQITDYRKYNLNENQPDAIFIHNPYDEYNWVTRVPGQFFSTELIKATKHLVYIPYMIRSGDTMPDHLVLMPGVANAWRVYVQSEAIRENYLKYYPFTNEIIAVGSPKIDMVLRMEEQEKVLPEQWREKLQGKKVFLYNTHLHNIINNADKLFAEYDYVLREFIGRDEVALLWRPHPLSVETIKTFKPYILDDYVKYLNQAEKQGNIVIDRSADLHRAIALSDAYVGDQSSLVELYGVTGKPIFIIDSEKFTNKKWSFRGFVEVDNELWIPEMIDKSLFKINKMTWKAEYVNQFFTKDFKDTIQAIPREIKNVHHKILSAFRQNILIYDIINGKMEQRDVCQILEFNNVALPKKVKIIKLIGYKDRVWLFPGFYDQPLLVYDYKDDSIIIDSRYEKVKELCQRKKNSNSAYGACVLAGDCVWAPILETNEVVGINLEDGEVSGVRLSKKTSRLITCSQNVLWVLSDRGSTLIRYDLVTKEERCFGFKEPVSDKTETLYRSLVSYEEFLYIMPLKADVLIVFDKERLSFTYINISMYKHEKEVDFSHLSGLPHQGGITLFPINHCELLQVEYRNEKWCIEQQALQIEPDELNRLFMEKDDQVYQSPNYPLNTFVDRVSNSMISNAGKDNLEFTKHLKYADGKCGERIWHEVLSALLLAQ